MCLGGILPPSVIILAVDDNRLLRMDSQPARRKALLQHRPQPTRLGLAVAVAEDIIGENVRTV